MDIGLSMIVKNEGNRLHKSLGEIYDLFDDIVVVDTGSEDNTLEILRNFHINPILYKNPYPDQRLIEARNFSIENNKAERILILDGDEHISREDIIAIKKINPSEKVDGYFVKWIDYRYKEPFEDYKMCLIRKNAVRFLFSVHACPQVYIRDNNKNGLWLNGISLSHYPEIKPHRQKYITQLENGIKENPGCMRFYWFLGYHYFKNQLREEAKKYLIEVINHKNTRFPVETLNSFMILASILQNEGANLASYQLIFEGLEFYRIVKNDFEVKINFRLYSRFKNTHNELINNHKAKIIPYEFAF
ncbi:MAG TPA: glycosyltransferase [Candidatus Absconditabacterales bacterium]|nr:glycosyltransferase [Candidatus Absconditabacterales bacterium]